MSEQDDIHQQVEKYCFQATEAINSNNLKAAFEFVSKAKSCLPFDSWTNESFYEQVLNVSLLYAECEYVSGNHSSAIEIYQNILPNIVDNVDRLKVRFLLLKSSSASSKYEIMYDEFIDLLASNPSTHCLVANGDTFTEKWIESTTLQIKESLESYSNLNDILQMKECDDEESVAFARCLLECIQGVYIGKNSNKIFLFVTPLLLFKSMLEDGLYMDLTHTIFTALGWQLAYLDDPKLGCDLSDVGCALALEHHSSDANYALTKFFELCITACKFGLDEVLKVSHDAFKVAETVEEISWGAQSGFWLGLASVLKGFNKDSNYNYLEEIKTFNRKCSREFESDLLACIEQIPLFLYGEIEGYAPSFLVEGFEEITFSRLIVFFTKALIYYFKGQFQEAAEQINESDDVVDDCFGTPFYMFYKWFSFIILSSFYEKYDEIISTKNQKKSKLSIMEVMLGPNAKAPKTMKEKTLERILEHEKDILDLHAKYPNFMEAAKIMCLAEVTKLHNGDKDEVIDHYVHAYEVATSQNMYMYAGLIQNRLCDYCVSKGIEHSFIKTYAENAIKMWKLCGANTMISKINDQFKDALSFDFGDSTELENLVPSESIQLSEILIKQTQSLLLFSKCDRLGIFIKEPNSKDFILLCEREKGRDVEIYEKLQLSQSEFKFSIMSLKICLNTKQGIIISNITGSDYNRNHLTDCGYLKQNQSVKEQMIIPIISEFILRGAILFESFTDETFDKLALRNTKIFVDSLIDGLATQNELFRSQRKLIPIESLKQIGKDAGSVKLGDSNSKRVTVLCLELRNFTEIIESSSGLSFVNTLIGVMSPIICNLGGFIERCTGPIIVAIFTDSAAKAISASVDIVKAVREIDKNINTKSIPSIGIGIHMGPCTFGVVGSSQLHTIMYSESFSVCLELSKLSNSIGTIIIASQEVLDSVNVQDLKIKSRKLGKFMFTNKKNHPYSAFEISGPDWIEYSTDISKNISQQVDECLDLFSKKRFDKVLSMTESLEKTVREKFENNPSLLGSIPHLKLIQMYREQSKRNMCVANSLLGDWSGEIRIDQSGNPQHLFEPSVKSEQVLVTPKANEVNEDIEKKLRSLQTQLEQLKSENENLRSYIKSEDSTGMNCFCVPSKKKVHPANK